MKVPFLEIKTQYESIKDEIKKELDDTLENTEFILGSKVEAFEKNFAEYCESKYAAAVNSGTSALHLALIAKGIGPGDEVITVPNTFIATVEAISYTGATPVFVDINKHTYTMDFTKIEQLINSKTKAIIPVHLYGQPAAMDRIMELANKYNLAIVEDCCQAHGATYSMDKVPISDVGCFSFYPGKNLGGYGEGGIIVSNNEEFIEKIKMLRNHGSNKRDTYKYVGYNYRMDGFQGAVLGVKLKKLKEWTELRRDKAILYGRLLNGFVQIPKEIEKSNPVYHIYTINVGKDRDELKKFLNEKEIDVRVYYSEPIHLQEAYKHLGYEEGSLPITEACCKETLALPLFPELTNEQIKYVCDMIKEFYDIRNNSK